MYVLSCLVSNTTCLELVLPVCTAHVVVSINFCKSINLVMIPGEETYVRGESPFPRALYEILIMISDIM